MSERVVFRPTGANPSIPFNALGQLGDGEWGIVDDTAWFATPGADSLDVLYLTLADYLHDVRELSIEGTGEVVKHRRGTFARQIPAIALGIVEIYVRDWIGALGTNEHDTRVRADLVLALASFAGVPRFAGIPLHTLLDQLREGDAQIVAEIESPSLRAAGDLDPSGDERATRRRFATEIVNSSATRCDPAERAHPLPHVGIERAYLLTPVPVDLERGAESFHDPTMHFRFGLIIPVAERDVGQLIGNGHHAAVVFPTRGLFIDALTGMSAVELQRELNERLQSPAFVPYLQALRVLQATLRTAVWLIGGPDAEVAPLLAQQLQEEASKLGAWIAAAPTGLSVPSTSNAAEVALDAATFLVALCQRHGTLSRTAGLEALARALSQISAKSKS